MNEIGPKPNTILLASGNNFPDALAGSGLAASTGAPIFLVDDTSSTLPTIIATYLKQLHDAGIHPNVRALGGTAVVPEILLNQAEYLLDGKPQIISTQIPEGVEKIYSEADKFYSVQQTKDGGYIVVGNRFSQDGDTSGLSKGDMDAIIAKYDPSGNLVWGKTFGGSDRDLFYSVVETNDGSYVAAGDSFSEDRDMSGINKGYNDAIIVKYASDGTLLSTKGFGGTGDDYFNSVQVTSDGGYIVCKVRC